MSIVKTLTTKKLCILVVLLLASCAAPLISPPQLRTGSTGSRSLEVTDIDSTSWRIQTPSGAWWLTCEYNGNGHQASVRFPDGSKLVLPEKAVTAACRAISEFPDASA